MKLRTVLSHIRSGLAYRKSNAIPLDVVLVVDVEATTAADRKRNALRDIIQIGACLLQMKTGAVEQPASVIVRPTCSEVTSFCTEITAITPEMAQHGLSFLDACDWLRTTYDSENKPWASYGAFDLTQFTVQCAREGLPVPFSDSHIDAKLIVALHAGWPRGKGLTRALAKLNMKHQGRHHDAKDDAENAARLLYRALSGAL